MSKIFITGANGFVGKALCLELEKRNFEYGAGVRTAFLANEISYGDIVAQNHWKKILKGFDVVVHLAARVHVVAEKSANPLKSFMDINCEATLNLAKAAKKSGVRRFIFISSVKVNGEETFKVPFGADDEPLPQDPYGVSKLEGERRLMLLHEPQIFEVVVIRPPLIYGPGVKANFANLYQFVKRDLPLPFGLAYSNRRSLVSVYNLVDLIILCSYHPQAGGNVFMASDDHDLSLKQLVLEMGKTLGKRPKLLPVPIKLMKVGARLLGKKDYADRLFGNLQVDIQKTKQLLDWRPKFTLVTTFKQ